MLNFSPGELLFKGSLKLMNMKKMNILKGRICVYVHARMCVPYVCAHIN